MNDPANLRMTQTPRRLDNWIFLSFLALIFLLGGSSRADILSLVVLRPVAAIVLVYAAAQYFRVRTSGLSMPIWLFVCWTGLILLQILPLPPSIWTILPGREVVVQAYADASLDPGWKPLTLVPMATMNSLQALFVPLAVIFLYSSSHRSLQRRALAAIVIFALLSAGLGVLQFVSGAGSWLYPYRISNQGSLIGLFANRNHQSAILASAIPMIFAFAEVYGKDARRTAIRWAARAIALALVILAVMTGSRSGTVLAIFALLASVAIFTSPTGKAKLQTSSDRKIRIIKRLGFPAALLAGITVIFLITKGAAFERFAEKDSLDDLRFQVLPQIKQMIMDSMPFGFGFGSFPEVYEIYEKVEFVYPSYLNHAHNDWLELVIEGGIFSLFLILIAVGWFARRCWMLRATLLKPITTGDSLRSAAALGIVILTAASLLDYPLRTPSGAAVLALLLGALATPRSGSRHQA